MLCVPGTVWGQNQNGAKQNRQEEGEIKDSGQTGSRDQFSCWFAFSIEI